MAERYVCEQAKAVRVVRVPLRAAWRELLWRGPRRCWLGRGGAQLAVDPNLDYELNGGSHGRNPNISKSPWLLALKSVRGVYLLGP